MEHQPRSKRILILVALLSSFVVYFVPILAVHTGTLPLGLVLLGALHGLDDGNVGYAVTSIAFVILIQILVGIAVYWMIARFRWWKCALLAVAAPLLAIFMNAGLLFALPALFLLERDPAREVGDLAEVCRVPGVFLAHVHAGVDGMLERRGTVFVRQRKHNQWALLSMPDCSIRDVGEIMTTTVPSVTADGAVLYRSNNKDGFELVAPGVPAIAIPAPKRMIGAGARTPILSDDGTGLVWLDRRPDESGPGKLNRHVLRWRPPDRDTVTTIELDIPSREQLTLIGANITANRYDVSRYRNQFYRLDGHGRAVGDVVTPSGTHNPRSAFRRFDGGWLAWDSYRDEGCYVVRWSLAGNERGISVPKGRTIDHVSVDPHGRFAAVAVRGSARLVKLASSLIVIRLADGEEVFRRFGEPYQRFWPAFLGPSHLAVSEFKNGQAVTTVYRLAADKL